MGGRIAPLFCERLMASQGWLLRGAAEPPHLNARCLASHNHDDVIGLKNRVTMWDDDLRAAANCGDNGVAWQFKGLDWFAYARGVRRDDHVLDADVRVRAQPDLMRLVAYSRSPRQCEIVGSHKVATPQNA